MAEEQDDLKFVNISVTADGLCDLTAGGNVWRFDPAAGLLEPLPVVTRANVPSPVPQAAAR
jgi:hypothetical protein